MATFRRVLIALALLVTSNMAVMIVASLVLAEVAYAYGSQRLRPCQDKGRVACTQLMSIGTKPVGASGNSMDLDAFWRIVEDARSGASDDEDFLRRIGSRLHMLKPEELLEFESRRSKLDADSYSWRLWGAAYLMNDGCSDDCFDYFRAWLISQGRRTFE